LPRSSATMLAVIAAIVFLSSCSGRLNRGSAAWGSVNHRAA